MLERGRILVPVSKGNRGNKLGWVIDESAEFEIRSFFLSSGATVSENESFSVISVDEDQVTLQIHFYKNR
jgi:hypothetical protein